MVLRIGLDLDDTIYGHPVFFRAFIDAMHAAGHKLYCISAHGLWRWEAEDIARLKTLGIDPAKLDPSGMTGDAGQFKAGAIEQLCDFAFDDNADMLNTLTTKPVFKAPVK